MLCAAPVGKQRELTPSRTQADLPGGNWRRAKPSILNTRILSKQRHIKISTPPSVFSFFMVITISFSTFFSTGMRTQPSSVSNSDDTTTPFLSQMNSELPEFEQTGKFRKNQPNNLTDDF
jgi:hypothetical protein